MKIFIEKKNTKSLLKRKYLYEVIPLKYKTAKFWARDSNMI